MMKNVLFSRGLSSETFISQESSKIHVKEWPYIVQYDTAEVFKIEHILMLSFYSAPEKQQCDVNSKGFTLIFKKATFRLLNIDSQQTDKEIHVYPAFNPMFKPMKV